MAHGPDRLYARLDKQLGEEFSDEESKLFFTDTNSFSPLHQVVMMLREVKTRQTGDLYSAFTKNAEYQKLHQRKALVDGVIEEVATFQNGGLNTTIEAMTDVIKTYTKGREDIRELRSSLDETKSVLTSKKSGQIPLRELWLRKFEVEETIRILKHIEFIKVSFLLVLIGLTINMSSVEQGRPRENSTTYPTKEVSLRRIYLEQI